MKLSKLILELQSVQKQFPVDLEVQLQNTPKPGEKIVGYESFFIVPENYFTEGIEETIVNLRTWPY